MASVRFPVESAALVFFEEFKRVLLSGQCQSWQKTTPHGPPRTIHGAKRHAMAGLSQMNVLRLAHQVDTDCVYS